MSQLTRRELEVLKLIALGLTNREIADRIRVSPRTVDAHLRSIYAKLEVRSRSAATRYAVDHGLV
ncbi:MAG: response regulator transcription factor, partial [Chloroflexi bacterium]